ncbi:hypothetical protein DP939_36200 [Spongiactinospora rosea]|uniref:Uncharacterized protein n=1 Tax=Spongiactinospora rosea TaxID=2248750 RepID=A0A366LPG5_9ACTN|nr:hypothetical protein [Spongiactinospora rosea]RBQ15289.1 hypothetical protein DP939_36200 [Spongiactinospora rosea]
MDLFGERHDPGEGEQWEPFSKVAVSGFFAALAFFLTGSAVGWTAVPVVVGLLVFVVGMLLGVRGLDTDVAPDFNDYDHFDDEDEDEASAREARLAGTAGLDAEGHTLYGRAWRAVAVVQESRAGRMGLLDDVANDVVLPRRLTGILEVLWDQAALRAEQADAMREAMTPELRAVLGPQREALARSVRAVTRQVEDLEEYARRVQNADSALRAHDLLDSNQKYLDLLARTEDAEGVRDLTAQAADLEAALAQSLRDAVSAGRTLALPAADDPPTLPDLPAVQGAPPEPGPPTLPGLPPVRDTAPGSSTLPEWPPGAHEGPPFRF